MKIIKNLTAAILTLFAVEALSATSVTLTWDNGSKTIDVPDEIASFINDNKSDIISKLNSNNVSADELANVAGQVTSSYDDFISKSGISSKPYTTAKNGLNDFSKVLLDVVPNTQIQQNVWANAWIGNLVPKPHFGFGINAGAALMDISPLVKTAKNLGMNIGIADKLALPTVTADLRLGGFGIPFDLGVTAMGIDSTKISALDTAIKPVSFDLFTIGGDFRFAFVKGEGYCKPRLSAGLGYFYTKGGVNVKSNDAEASLGFNSNSIVLSAQASVKVYFFVPFIGAKVMFNQTNVDWKVKAKWEKILPSSGNDYLSQAALWGFLPESFSGGASSTFFDHVRPVIFGGFAFDLFVFDLTFNASYDFISQIPAAGFSLRFAIN